MSINLRGHESLKTYIIHYTPLRARKRYLKNSLIEQLQPQYITEQMVQNKKYKQGRRKGHYSNEIPITLISYRKISRFFWVTAMQAPKIDVLHILRHWLQATCLEKYLSRRQVRIIDSTKT